MYFIYLCTTLASPCVTRSQIKGEKKRAKEKENPSNLKGKYNVCLYNKRSVYSKILKMNHYSKHIIQTMTSPKLVTQLTR